MAILARALKAEKNLVQRERAIEDTFEESFGPYMQLGGKTFVLGLLDLNSPAVQEVDR